MSNIKVTSIDDILRWLNVDLDTDLPDPGSFNHPYYVRPILHQPVCPALRDEEDVTAAQATYRKEEFKKEKIMFDGRILWVWRRM